VAEKTPPDSAEAYRDALKMIAPGTQVREGLNAILQSGTGALLCFGDKKKLSHLSEGGVQLDADASPQLLYELSKMDGAILLSQNGDKIYYANRFLRPAAKIPSDETGTRHRAAQRMANQGKCVVLAISERRSTVTLYVHDRRHLLEDIPGLVNRAMQALQTLEKFMTVLNQSLQELTVREFQDVVTIFDICKTVQRTQMVRRIAQEIEPYLLELGDEGRLIDLQLQELTGPLNDAELVVRDYYKEKAGTTLKTVQKQLSDVTEDELINLGNLSQALGYGANLRNIDTYLSPRGYRVLTSTHRLPAQIIENLVERFGTLQQIIRAPKEALVEVDGVGDVLAERIRVSISLLRNQLALEERR